MDPPGLSLLFIGCHFWGADVEGNYESKEFPKRNIDLLLLRSSYAFIA
jgi:hypothetical protein